MQKFVKDKCKKCYKNKSKSVIIKGGISSQPEGCFGSSDFLTFNTSRSLVGRGFSLAGIRTKVSFVCV